jgi:hypothetical protein
VLPSRVCVCLTSSSCFVHRYRARCPTRSTKGQLATAAAAAEGRTALPRLPRRRAGTGGLCSSAGGKRRVYRSSDDSADAVVPTRTRTRRRTGRAAVQVARPRCAPTAEDTQTAHSHSQPVSTRIRMAQGQETMRTDKNVLAELSYPVWILRCACGVSCVASCAVPSTAAVRSALLR